MCMFVNTKPWIMKKEYKITANYKFYPSFIERLRAQAKHERRTMTSIIEYAVNLYIENNSPGSAGDENNTVSSS